MWENSSALVLDHFAYGISVDEQKGIILATDVDKDEPIVEYTAELKVHIESHIVINRCDLIRTISQYRTPVLDKTTIDWIIKTIQQNHVVANKDDLKRHKNQPIRYIYKTIGF